MSDPSVAQVLAFWFGSSPDDSARAQQRWFAATPEDDLEIRNRFGDTLVSAAQAGLDDWTRTADGRLAFILVCDQFSRNIHRGTAQAFATDHLALREAKLALDSGQTRDFAPRQRSFALMPLEHSENAADQARCVAEFERLLNEAPADLQAQCATWLEHARNHQTVIERFGRFPSRNAVLGRSSTDAEQDWLAAGGAGFGGQSSAGDSQR